ncbi:MAG: phytanoyl-CoA dioxygenase family protein [Chthoniobacterales bacterium]
MSTSTLEPIATPKTLSVEQVEQFNELGYFVVKDLFTKHEVAEMLAECEAILAGEYSELYQGAFQVDPGSTDEKKAERKITAVVERSAIFRKHLLKDALVRRMQDILGEDILLFRDILMLKPALVGSKMPWHQDSNYWKIAPTELCSAWTALDPATSENGCMQVIPRSHRLPLIKSRLEEGSGPLEDDQVSLDQAIEVPMEPGSSLFFHSRLLHGSNANLSPNSRRAFITSMMSAKSTQTKFGPYIRSRYFQVSGKSYPDCVKSSTNVL